MAAALETFDCWFGCGGWMQISSLSPHCSHHVILHTTVVWG